jgi:hypothetical protein
MQCVTAGIVDVTWKSKMKLVAQSTRCMPVMIEASHETRQDAVATDLSILPTQQPKRD